MASARIRTQAYTAVICIADRSVTDLPEMEPPIKKVYPLPAVRSTGLSRDLKMLEKILIATSYRSNILDTLCDIIPLEKNKNEL